MENDYFCDMKENEIAEFDPLIYPRRLWVVVGRERYESRFDGVTPWSDDAYAITDRAYDRESGKGGIMVRFGSVGDMTFSNMAHEAVHVAAEIYDYCGIKAEMNNSEHLAYLVGWAARCMGQVKEDMTKTPEME